MIKFIKVHIVKNLNTEELGILYEKGYLVSSLWYGVWIWTDNRDCNYLSYWFEGGVDLDWLEGGQIWWTCRFG